MFAILLTLSFFTKLQVRDPMPAVFFFLIDVSMNALQTGATAAACSSVSQAIADLPVNLHIIDHLLIDLYGCSSNNSDSHVYGLKIVYSCPRSHPACFKYLIYFYLFPSSFCL